MTLTRIFLAVAAATALTACSDRTAGSDPPSGGTGPLYEDVTDTHLPAGVTDGLSMDAAVADVDGDGDLDIVVAHEFRPNILLLNDGRGRFTDGSDRLPSARHDSEDVGITDFDGDGDLDIVVVSEDDETNELYFNDGAGRFVDEGGRLPVTGTSNAVVVADLTGDGAPDIVIGNNGPDAFLENDGGGGFVDATDRRLPGIDDVTQDLELGDVDEDGDLDLLVGNEDRNRLLLNDGTGVFEDASEGRIPLREGEEETREADFGDVDGDGDLDVLFANVRAFVEGADLRNRLLVNDGAGAFVDETDARLPADGDHSFDGDFLDVDGDGDLDVVTSNSVVDLSRGQIDPAPWRVYLNDGRGMFDEATERVLPATAVGTGFDAVMADFDGDGAMDLYLASRGTADRLLLGAEGGRAAEQ
ncbi:MAG: VCBS repeat-containing protein [Gemmatimonadota bacterium]|jgi:hypothetical protein